LPPAMVVKTLQDDFGRTACCTAGGMTEMSPVGTINTPKAKHLDLPAAERFAPRAQAGPPGPTACR